MNSHESTFENSTIHIKAHAAKIQIVAISKFLIANIIYSYIHSNTSMKLPEIPGKIIAQIAIAQQINMYGHVISTDKDAHELKALFKAHTTEKLVVEAHTGMVDHEMQVQRTNSFWRRLIARKDLVRLKLAVSYFDVLIALTEEDAYCWNMYIQTFVMPNALTHYPSVVANLPDEKKRVISVGRLDYQKGQDLLLMAWQEVERHHPDWSL